MNEASAPLLVPIYKHECKAKSAVELLCGIKQGKQIKSSLRIIHSVDREGGNVK